MPCPSPSPDEVKQFITQDEAAKAMVECAEKMGMDLTRNEVKAHQIRNVYGTMKKLEMEEYSTVTQRHLHLLKPRLAYAAARQEGQAKAAMMRLGKCLGHAIDAVTDAATFQRFCQFFEAILAYHKVHGGN